MPVKSNVTFNLQVVIPAPDTPIIMQVQSDGSMILIQGEAQIIIPQKSVYPVGSYLHLTHATWEDHVARQAAAKPKAKAKHRGPDKKPRKKRVDPNTTKTG